MGTISWPSAQDSELVQIEFLKLDGTSRSLKLLVDTGFTGKSSFVLSEDAVDLMRAPYHPAQVAGALQGQQDRGWVMCCVPAISFRRTLIAIIADTSSLSLPHEVAGLAGLTFLRQFPRWGAEQSNAGWRFFISDEV